MTDLIVVENIYFRRALSKGMVRVIKEWSAIMHRHFEFSTTFIHRHCISYYQGRSSSAAKNSLSVGVTLGVVGVTN